MDSKRTGLGEIAKGIGRELLGEATKMLGRYTLALTEAKLEQAAKSLQRLVEEKMHFQIPTSVAKEIVLGIIMEIKE